VTFAGWDEVGRELGGDHGVHRPLEGAAHIDQAPCRRVRQQLLPRAVAKGDRNQIRFHPVRAQCAHELADQDFRAAADKRRLAFENEDPLHRYVRTRSS